MPRAKAKTVDPTVRYAPINGKIRKCYLVETYTQVDIFGDNREIARVSTTKKAGTLHLIEVDKLLTATPDKPRRPKRSIYGA